MKIAFTEAGWEDYLWFQQNDRKRLTGIITTNNSHAYFTEDYESQFGPLRVIREDERSPFSYAPLFALIFCLPHR